MKIFSFFSPSSFLIFGSAIRRRLCSVFVFVNDPLSP